MTTQDLIETLIEMPVSAEHLRQLVRRIPELSQTSRGRRAVKSSYKLADLKRRPSHPLHDKITRRGEIQNVWRHLGVHLGYMTKIV